MSPLPPPLLTALTNPSSYPTCCGCCLQSGHTALTEASEYGHIKIVQALLAAPGIDVNHAHVSIYLLTPSQSHVVVRGEGGGALPCPIIHLNPRNTDLSPPNLENVPYH